MGALWLAGRGREEGIAKWQKIGGGGRRYKLENSTKATPSTPLQKGTQVSFEIPAEIPAEYENLMFRLPKIL